MEKKYNVQITKFANKMSLMDFQDNINDMFANAKGEMVYSNKIILNVNNYGGQNHKEKYASYYIDIEDALFLAKHITSKTFAEEVVNVYQGKENKGVYMTYAGNKVARVFSLKYQADKKRYEVKVGLYQPIKGDNGQTSPNWKAKIDEHACYLAEDEFIKMMLMIQTYIGSALTVRQMKETFPFLAFGGGQVVPPTSTPFVQEEKKEEAPQPKPIPNPIPAIDQPKPVFINIQDDDLPF